MRQSYEMGLTHLVNVYARCLFGTISVGKAGVRMMTEQEREIFMKLFIALFLEGHAMVEIHPLLWRPETFRLTHQL